MSASARLLNAAWMWWCAPEAARFDRACRHVADTQSRLLRQTLHANRDTEFGRAHGFEAISDPRTYRERVSLATGEDLADPVRRIAEGESNVLTREAVRLLEPTSGTTGGEKLIPYTEGLRRQFGRGVSAWIADLFRHRPAVRGGRAYWSISPMLGPPRRSPGGLPIGFDDDVAYLARAEQFAVRRLLVTPPEVSRMPELDSFRYATLLTLLAAEDLTLISVWSPTFLTALLAPLELWRDRLCRDLRFGSFNPPSALTEDLRQCLHCRLRPDPTRADRLAGIFGSNAPPADLLRRIWPRLALISCWADAAAATYLAELRAVFPDVEIQPKGLLATEGFVSVPRTDLGRGALALRCHFFEFQEIGDPRIHLADELEVGGRYRVVITTAGGLYRYQLGDEIEVVGMHHRCPLLRFTGKRDTVSDLVGEKLAEPHVRAVLDRLVTSRGLRPRIATLVPVQGPPPCYRLYLQSPGLAPGSPRLGSLLQELEEGLRENPHYRLAVDAGQLAPAEVVALDPEGESAWLRYERRCLQEGQRPGNIKPMALDRRLGWPEVFAPLEGASASDRR